MKHKQENLAEGDITEEMLAKRLRHELNLFKQGQHKDNELSSKSKVKDLHNKDTGRGTTKLTQMRHK